MNEPLLSRTEPRRAAGAVWRVRLLGGFEADDGRHRHTRLRSRAAMALLARVALAPSRDHAREELAALLWPEADAESGRSRLRQTLSLLKAVLEPPGASPVLLADRRVVRAAPGVLWCDALAFEDAVRRGAAAEASALYRGEFLPGFYDEWIHDERRRLQALADGLQPAAPAAVVAVPVPRTTATATPAPTAPVAPPAPAALLPHYLTRLVGADRAGARLRALATEQRLVTVLGPGGCGKTRLAVEVAHHALAGTGRGAPAFDGAAFVSLVDVADATGLHDRLQQALRLAAGGDPVAALQQALAGRCMLLLLDNAEQLDDAAAGAIATLAERLPAVHWIVTSRRALGLDGEHTLLLESLPLPAPDAPLDEVAMNPAVALYVDRARAHRPDFHVGVHNRDALAALVQRLEGLPLALELAASQARTLGPAQLLALLEAERGSLDLLARRGPRSGSDPRHASMRGVVEWSWRLLPPPLQALLAALAPLPAGACRPLAAALAGGLSPGVAQVQLDALVAHSVLRVHPGLDGEPRYAAYEPVREYVLGLDDPAAARARRLRLLQALLDWAGALPATPPLPAVRDELPNVTLALQHAAADGASDEAARLVLMLQSSWGEMALPRGVLQALDRLVEDPALDPGLAAGVHALAGTHRQQAGEPEAVRDHMRRALERLAQAPAPDPAVHTMVLSRVARLHWRVDHDAARARALIEQALPLARLHDRPNTEASLISLQGHLATVVDRDPARGAELAAQSLALWRRSGNRHLVNAGRFNVATHRMKAGHAAETLPEWDDLEREGRELQDWDLASGALEGKGTALQALRRWAESAAALRESVRVAWEGLETLALAYALWNLPPALVRLRQGELAAETMGAAEALFRARFGSFDESDARDLRRIRRSCRVLLGAEATAAAWQRGARRPLAESVRAVIG